GSGRRIDPDAALRVAQGPSPALRGACAGRRRPAPPAVRPPLRAPADLGLGPRRHLGRLRLPGRVPGALMIRRCMRSPRAGRVSGMTDAIDYARYDRIRPIRWTGEALELLDQRQLPFVVEYLACRTSDEVAAAIHSLAVRGAPAIGI